MTIIRPNSITGVSSITTNGGDLSLFRSDGTTSDIIVNNVTSGVVTATTFVGNLTGNPTGSGANLTSLPAGQLTGTVADARLTTVSSSKLSGALPALDGSALTGVGVGTADSINTSGIITATAFVSSQGTLSNRNKIINGDFTVHQRGGTITAGSGIYTLDRWRAYNTGSSSGAFTVQQSTGSYPQTNISGVIDNFKASAFITVTSAGSDAANNNCKFQQRIEGSNVYDLAFGTVAAKNVTVSFYVKCSITGTFGVALVNGAHNRSNVQTYTVNSATTWERKVLTFVGDTSGSWVTNTGTGLQLMFDMGSGSDKYTGSLNTWVSGEKHGTSTSTKLLHTNGATMQYAGVQLEAGDVATPFEHRSYADELIRCQRYYFKITADDNDSVFLGYSTNGSSFYGEVPFPTSMRSMPTFTGSNTAARYFSSNTSNDFTISNLAIHGSHTSANPHHTSMYVAISSADGGTAGVCQAQNAVGTFEFSSEL